MAASFPRGDGARATSSAAKPRPNHNAVLATNPWLLCASWPAPFLLVRARALSAHVSDREGQDKSNDGAPSVQVTEDDVFKELQHHRDLLVAGCADNVGVEHFSIVIRGGAWTTALVGAVVDGVRVSGSTAQAQKYRATHHLPHSVKCSSKLYGEDACRVLSKFRVFRMGVFSHSSC